MGYRDYLAELLEPLGLYDLSEGAGAAELELVGDELDRIFLMLEQLEAEMTPLTASEYGLLSYEDLFPYKPSFITHEDRRRAVMALMRVRNGCFTIENLNNTVSGCGINTLVKESSKPMTLEVSFPDNWGIPEEMAELRKRIESILPCHLAVEYVYRYSCWELIMAVADTWGDVEASCENWKELEILR